MAAHPRRATRRRGDSPVGGRVSGRGLLLDTARSFAANPCHRDAGGQEQASGARVDDGGSDLSPARSAAGRCGRNASIGRRPSRRSCSQRVLASRPSTSAGCLACRAATQRAADESIWRLRRPGVAAADSQGWRVIGHATGLRIVSAILGIPGPRVHRALGTTERGVLAAASSAIIRQAPGLALAGARPDEWSGSGLARIEGWAESETFRETFFLALPPSWHPEVVLA